MKALISSITFGFVLALTAGCEGGWQFGGSSQSWNSSEGWVDFSGRYQPSIAGRWLVSDYSSSSSATSAVNEVMFTSTPGQLNYAGAVNVNGAVPAQIVGQVGDQGTFTVSAAGNIGAGTIAGISGTINLSSGAFGITIPAAYSTNITFSIVYAKVGSSAPGGSGIAITAFEVTQEGNTLRIIDNNGSVYTGNLGAYTTLGSVGVGDTTNGLVGAGGQTATVQYDVHGVSAAGMNVEMAGNLLAQVSQSVSIVGGTATNIVLVQQTWNRYIRGTWIEQGGKSGNIDGQADPIVTTTQGGNTGGG